MAYHATAPSYEDLKKEGAQLVGIIERFHTEQGRYPSTLEEARICPPSNRYGPWRYDLYSDRGVFSIAIGDYNEDNFVLNWSSDTCRWNLDT